MNCPKCASCTIVKDSRPSALSTHENALRRRRTCTACGLKFTTFELFIDDLPGIRTGADGRVMPRSMGDAAEFARLLGLLSQDDARTVLAVARRFAGVDDNEEDREAA